MNTSTTISIIGIAIVIIGAGAYIVSHRSADEGTATLTLPPSSTPVDSTVSVIEATPDSTPPIAVSPSPDAMAAQNPTISITDQGFSPAEITIKAGATVTFVNNGKELHWPASDPHPVHTDLSGFDAKRGLASGDLYRFTFTSAGSFGMHDHLHSALKGRIIVQ